MFTSFNAAPANGAYYGAIYPGQVHCSDLSGGTGNTDSSNAAYQNSLAMFTKALDVWLPQFAVNNGTKGATNTGSASSRESSTSLAENMPNVRFLSYYHRKAYQCGRSTSPVHGLVILHGWRGHLCLAGAYMMSNYSSVFSVAYHTNTQCLHFNQRRRTYRLEPFALGTSLYLYTATSDDFVAGDNYLKGWGVFGRLRKCQDTSRRYINPSPARYRFGRGCYEPIFECNAESNMLFLCRNFDVEEAIECERTTVLMNMGGSG
jgi:hypothetical protein